MLPSRQRPTDCAKTIRKVCRSVSVHTDDTQCISCAAVIVSAELLNLAEPAQVSDEFHT